MLKKFKILSRETCWPSILTCFCLIIITGISWRSFWVDDAFIGFRCIENFLAGKGFVFNAGMRVESVTNIGWLLLLTPLVKVAGPAISGKIAGGFLLLISAWLVCSMGAEIDKAGTVSESNSFLRYFVPLTAFSGPALLYFSHSGMETALVCAMIASAFFFVEHSRRLLWIAAIYSFAYLVRPECVLLFPLFLLAEKFSNEKKTESGGINHLFYSLIIWGAIICSITLARYAYFGDIFPNTFYAKPASILGFIVRFYASLAGNSINLPGLFAGLFTVPVVILGLRYINDRSPRLFSICFAGAATGAFFAIYSADDWTSLPRYFAPYSPFYLFLVFAGLQEFTAIIDEKGKKVAFAFTFFVFMFFLLNNLVDQVRWLGQSARDRYPGYVLMCKPLWEPALDMTGLLPENAVVATRRIGLIGFLSHCEIFDYTFGLPDKDMVAARRAVGGRTFDDPTDVGLKEIWMRRKPGYFLEDRSRINKLPDSKNNSPSEFEIHGIKYREVRSYKLGETEDWVLCVAVVQ